MFEKKKTLPWWKLAHILESALNNKYGLFIDVVGNFWEVRDEPQLKSHYPSRLPSTPLGLPSKTSFFSVKAKSIDRRRRLVSWQEELFLVRLVGGGGGGSGQLFPTANLHPPARAHCSALPHSGGIFCVSTPVFLVGGGMSWLGGQIDRLKGRGRDRELINLTVVHICNVRAMDPLL